MKSVKLFFGQLHSQASSLDPRSADITVWGGCLMSAQARGPINPYVVGQTIKGEYGFYGRHNLVEAVVNTLITTQQNTIVLHGQRRIGKSSLLHRLRRDKTLGRTHLPVFFDLQLRQGFPLARILADLAQTISDELNLSVPLPDEVSLVADYHQFRRAFLPEIYRHLDDKRLLILFDEFDVVVPPDVADRFPADTLLGYLQIQIEEDQQHLAFVFVVGQRLDLLAEGYRRLFRGARTEPVGRLGQKDTYELLTELGQQGGISYTDDALAEIWALTNGHPYLAQLLGSEIFDRLQKQGSQQASATDVEACLDKAMEHGLGALDWFWRGFNHEEKLVLAAVAELTDHQQSINDAEIEETLRQHLLFLTDVDRRNAYRQLIQGDFLVDVGGQRYQFAVEFIRRWIVKHHSLKEAQRQIAQGSPEAQHHYQEGLRVFQKGGLDEAIKNYRQALKHDPHFSGPRLALARVLRAQGETEAAIAEYEEAYQLDPATAREELIELHLDCARNFEKASDDEATLVHTRRILQIDPRRAEARRILSSIYLRQARAYLEDFKLAEALDAVRNLIEPLPIIQDPGVGQHIRDLWLNYSRELTQRKPPNWDEARHALGSLASLGLLDETARAAYNQMIIDKARDSLERDKLDQALATLQGDLKPPLPVDDVKDLLGGYSRQQIKNQRWEQATSALEGLCCLIEDEDSQTALLELYHQWGDTLLETEKFDAAIAVYQRGETGQNETDFKQKITDIYLRKANRHLERQELSEAEASYRQALATLNTEAPRGQARDRLETYFNDRLDEGAWGRANNTLKILKDLGLAADDLPALQTDLDLAQARAELEQRHLDVAFQRLAALGEETSDRIKTLVRAYLRQKASNSEWATGAAALKRLNILLANDVETTYWRANWLFIWARALLPLNDKTNQKPARAKYLCQKILNFAPTETPVINLLADSATTKKDAPNLRYDVCALYADIALVQAQNCLDQDNLNKARDLFGEALGRLPTPEDLTADILERLQTFSERQILKENWEQARRALETTFELGIGGPEISQSLTTLAIRQAKLLLKSDQPVQAFSILNHLKAEIKDAERQNVKTMVYQFSRLYAGRARWSEAKQAIQGLREWLAPQDEEEMARSLDVLNYERLYLVRGKRLATRPLAVPAEEVEYLEEEIRVIEDGCKDAEDIRTLQPDAPDTWIGHFVEASLQLGHAYLANDNLADAIQTYEKILNVESQRTEHKDQVSQSLYDYSERMLDQRNWEKARLAMEALKSLNLPAPDGQTRPDPRVDGTIQQVLLRQAHVLLDDDHVEETFAQLRAMPHPWPAGEVKEIIRDYSQKCGAQDDWPNAITALQHLDEFLASDRQQARDQQALRWLVDGLEQWGQHLEKKRRLEKATDFYLQALTHTRQAARPRNLELAAHYTRVVLRLAQNRLNRDPLTPETPPVINQAIQQYQAILGLPEHQDEHTRQINEALHNHARKLAEASQWGRAYQMLDYLDTLYPTPKDNDRTLFATWRRDLILSEVRTRLEERQLDAAATLLEWLKGWLDEYSAPKATWTDSEGEIKTLVDGFCQTWLQDEKYEIAVQFLEHLVRLLPDDSEIKGWEISALVRWGQSLHRQNNLKEALTRYEQALAKAPKQDLIPLSQIERHLMETRLAYAQQHLQQHNLDTAIAIYEQVLQQPGDHPDRADTIRQVLKSYSEILTQQTPPDWEAAHQALDSLLRLNLGNSLVFKWRQKLTLQEMEARLQQDNLNVAFARLETLERPWPVGDIQDIVHHYGQTHARGDTWPLAIEALQRLGAILAEDTSARQWVIRELMALGDLLEVQGNPGARAAFEAAVDFY
jgi:tetratricopeptide (TPR) repeat protein